MRIERNPAINLKYQFFYGNLKADMCMSRKANILKFLKSQVFKKKKVSQELM